MPAAQTQPKLCAFSTGNDPSWHQNGNRESYVASTKDYLFLKRILDVVGSTAVILGLMSWLLPIIALFIKFGSKGPVFFKQSRIGLNGRSFTCLKFRTMILNSEADEIPAREDDPRITAFCGFLRKTNLDELPQFFNVMVGHMSIVGPRPHMLKDCIRFSFVISCYSFRNLVRPGITGWAQVQGCYGPTPDFESILSRYYWDAQYVRKMNLWLDIKILLLTFSQAFRKLTHGPVACSRCELNRAIVIEMKKELTPECIGE